VVGVLLQAFLVTTFAVCSGSNLVMHRMRMMLPSTTHDMRSQNQLTPRIKAPTPSSTIFGTPGAMPTQAFPDGAARAQTRGLPGKKTASRPSPIIHGHTTTHQNRPHTRPKHRNTQASARPHLGRELRIIDRATAGRVVETRTVAMFSRTGEPGGSVLFECMVHDLRPVESQPLHLVALPPFPVCLAILVHRGKLDLPNLACSTHSPAPCPLTSLAAR